MTSPRTDLGTRARYAQGGGIHRIIPAAVVRPATIDALYTALRWAQAQGMAVTPRGAGSAMSGSAVGSGLILDLTTLDDGDRLTLSPEAGRVRTGAGVTLHEIAAAAS